MSGDEFLREVQVEHVWIDEAYRYVWTRDSRGPYLAAFDRWSGREL